jgi:predicted Zn finger-like uncharacterized protein
MRLICPNCGAQYEVPPEAIPPAGRDVQCSACSHTWFVTASAAPEPAAGPEPWDLVPRASDDDEEADDLAEAKVAPTPTPAPVAPVAAPRSSVTPEVADILRAEADREARTRADEASKRKEVPPPIPPAAPPPPRRVPEPSIAPEPLREASRSARPARLSEREIDIQQVNSSLRTANARIGGKAPQVGPARRRGGGFAGGFWGALLILAVLAGLYIAAPTIMEAAPQTRFLLDPYVGVVDSARVWLDQQTRALRGGAAAD